MKALILTGGKSSRMGTDKSQLEIGGVTLLERTIGLIKPLTEDIYISVAHDDTEQHPLPTIKDLEPSPGPLGGLQAAFDHDPNSTWLLIACDLPKLSPEDLSQLLENQGKDVTCFLNPLDDHPEPLCAIYAPSASTTLNKIISENRRCARKFIRSLDRVELRAPEPQALLNLNRPELLTELQLLNQHGSMEKTITIEYFAKLSQEAKTTCEELTTTAATLAGLWEEVRLRHHFTLDLPHIKAAVDNEFSDWETPLKNYDTIAFMPPFAGG